MIFSNSYFKMLIEGCLYEEKYKVLCHILENMKNTFGNVKIFTGCRSQALYERLEGRFSHLQIYENFDESIKYVISDLVIFDDDFCLEKDRMTISYFHHRSRTKEISIMYFSLSYCDVPKNIRNDLNYCVIKTLRGHRVFINEHISSSEELKRLRKVFLQKKKNDYIFIDLDKPTGKRFKYIYL